MMKNVAVNSMITTISTFQFFISITLVWTIDLIKYFCRPHMRAGGGRSGHLQEKE
jgi:hypothetical protein